MGVVNGVLASAQCSSLLVNPTKPNGYFKYCFILQLKEKKEYMFTFTKVGVSDWISPEDLQRYVIIDVKSVLVKVKSKIKNTRFETLSN